jgi:hypothetical protein
MIAGRASRSDISHSSVVEEVTAQTEKLIDDHWREVTAIAEALMQPRDPHGR